MYTFCFPFSFSFFFFFFCRGGKLLRGGVRVWFSFWDWWCIMPLGLFFESIGLLFCFYACVRIVAGRNIWEAAVLILVKFEDEKMLELKVFFGWMIFLCPKLYCIWFLKSEFIFEWSRNFKGKGKDWYISFSNFKFVYLSKLIIIGLYKY